MNIEDLESMNGVKLPKAGQICIVVPNIGKTVRYYSKFLNINPWFRSKTTSNDVVFKGDSFSIELDIARTSLIAIIAIRCYTFPQCRFSFDTQDFFVLYFSNEEQNYFS